MHSDCFIVAPGRNYNLVKLQICFDKNENTGLTVYRTIAARENMHQSRCAVLPVQIYGKGFSLIEKFSNAQLTMKYSSWSPDWFLES